MKVKVLLNYQLKNEVSWANFNIYKRIFNWQPFMNRVCGVDQNRIHNDMHVMQVTTWKAALQSQVTASVQI